MKTTDRRQTAFVVCGNVADVTADWYVVEVFADTPQGLGAHPTESAAIEAVQRRRDDRTAILRRALGRFRRPVRVHRIEDT